MKRIFFNKQKNMLLTIIIGILMIAVLIAIPTGYEDALIYQGSELLIAELSTSVTIPTARSDP